MYPNFYENLEEMQRRLLGSIVTYDGVPGSVLAITNHMKDSIFRIYWLPAAVKLDRNCQYAAFRNGKAEQGQYLDKYLQDHPECGILRKHANSPAFNKFRPFPLGMLNKHGEAVYLERTPERKTLQGLAQSMVLWSACSLESHKDRGRYQGSLNCPEFHDCVMGTHPSAKECLENLLDPSNENSSVAFDRNFAFVRGPMDTFFLQYKTDVVGFVPASTNPQVELGKKFKHLKEVVEETKQFSEVRVRS